MRKPSAEMTFSELHLPRPLEAPAALALLVRWAADRDAPRIVLEVRADTHGVRYVLGARPTEVQGLRAMLEHLLPGTILTALEHDREPVDEAGGLRLSPSGIALAVDHPEATTTAILAAMATRLRTGETIAAQLVLGPRLAPTHLPTSPVDPRQGVLDTLVSGARPAPKAIAAQMAERRRHGGFQCAVRIGAASPDAGRRRRFITSLLGAVSTAQSPGVQLNLRRENPTGLHQAQLPRRWPLRLSTPEVLAFTGWPLGDADLPGLAPIHPRRIRPAGRVHQKDRVFAVSAAPGDTRPIGIAIADQMMHGIAYGPSGSGKTTALSHLILADIAAGRPVCVVDPKWQLIDHLLARIPEHRRKDVVLLNAASPTPVGFNPLDVTGRDPDVVVDGILAVFAAIFSSGWGPRTEDIISAGLRTLAKTSSSPATMATLIDLPKLLTDPGFRRPRVAAVRGDDGLTGFWDWYEALSPGAQANAIAAPLNKIRSLLLRPALVRMLSQTDGAFRLRDIWRGSKIVLVPLNEGLIGTGTASLLGSLIIADLWQAAQERGSDHNATLRPGMVYVDEAPRFLHLPVSMADALAVSRSLSVGWFLAAQFRTQFPTDVRAAIDMNARNKIVFATEEADARAFAKHAPALSTEDFLALPKYHAYANLVADGHPSGWAMLRTLPETAAITDPSAVAAASERRFAPAVGAPNTSVANAVADPGARASTPIDYSSSPVGRKRRTR